MPHCCDSTFLLRLFCRSSAALRTNDYARGACRNRCPATRTFVSGRAEARQDLARHGETRPPKSSAGATSGGDGRRLRGIPAVSRGTSGAIAGTDPVSALLAKGCTGTQR